MKKNILLRKPLFVVLGVLFVLGISILSMFLTDTKVAAQNRAKPGRISQDQIIQGQKAVLAASAVVNFKKIAETEKRSGFKLEPSEIPPFMPVPEMPVTAEVLIRQNQEFKLEVDEGYPNRLVVGAIVSPTPHANFQGLNDGLGSIPPDTHGAVGPNHLMVVLNTQVRIQNKTGGTISTVGLNGFWTSVNDGTGAFDPKVMYDPFAGRWMFTACDDARLATSGLMIGVSQTNDPTGTWNLYKYDYDAADLEWADYPSIGFNKNWIAVSMNDFTIAGAFSGAHTYVFDKSTLYAGAASPTVTPYDHGTTFGGTHVPAATYDNTLNTLHLAQLWNSSSGGNGFLRLYTITGTAAAPVITPTGFFPSTTAWTGSSPDDFAPQSGTATGIMTNDARIQNVVYRDGKLWTAHTIFLPAGAPTRSSAQWWDINPNTGAVNQVGRIDDPTGTNFFAFPSIAVNAANQALVGYSAFSAATFASAAYSYRGVADASSTIRDSLVYKPGLDCYRKTFSGTRNRWGDYSHTVVDPTDDTTFWTLQEYADTAMSPCMANNNGRWGVWWAKLIPPCTSQAASGDWNTASTWGCGGVPTAADDAVIITGQNVTLDVDPNAASVTVNSGGTLTLNSTRTASSDIIINGTLDLANSVLNMGASTLKIGCNGTISGVSATGFVVGNVQKQYCSASGSSFTYPLGDSGGNYSPFAVANLSGTGSLTASVTDAFLPDLGTTHSASRFWSLSGSGVTADLSFTYADSDVNGAEINYKVFRRSGITNTQITPFSLNTGTNTATVTGISSFSDWGVGNLIPTAASVSISGRVTNANGRGIANVSVSLAGRTGLVGTARTNPFGYYRFEGIEIGTSYVLSVSSRLYIFANPTRVVSVQDEITGADFKAQPF